MQRDQAAKEHALAEKEAAAVARAHKAEENKKRKAEMQEAAAVRKERRLPKKRAAEAAKAAKAAAKAAKSTHATGVWRPRQQLASQHVLHPAHTWRIMQRSLPELAAGH